MDGGEPIEIDSLLVDQFHLNVRNNIIVITEDKAKLILQDHLKTMEQRQGWIAPFGLFVSFVLALLTTEFKDAVLGDDVWESLFIVAAVCSLFWFAISVRRARKATTVHDVVAQMKNAARDPNR